jgi:D-sedoheptulose 7-phosphate isomerase
MSTLPLERSDASATKPDSVEDFIRVRVGQSIATKQRLAADLAPAAAVASLLVTAFGAGKKLLLFGNGGSAADAQHIAAEFMGRFYITRRPLPALAVTVNPSTVTAIANDFGFEDIFARQIEALANPGDVAIGLSTSGRSPNVIAGLHAARRSGTVTVAMTGDSPGPVGEVAEVCVSVPASDTPRIQEVHILLGHVWSEYVEEALFGERSGERRDLP